MWLDREREGCVSGALSLRPGGRSQPLVRVPEPTQGFLQPPARTNCIRDLFQTQVPGSFNIARTLAIWGSGGIMEKIKQFKPWINPSSFWKVHRLPALQGFSGLCCLGLQWVSQSLTLTAYFCFLFILSFNLILQTFQIQTKAVRTGPVGSCPLPVSPQPLLSECCVPITSYRDASRSGLGPTPVASF